MIFIAGIGIAVFIEFLLISKKNKSESDKILSVWMFLITVHLLLFYIFFTGNAFHYPFLLGVELPFPLLHGVFLYLYVGSVTNQLPRQRKFLFLHFLPITVSYISMSIFFILPAEQKVNVYKNNGAGYEIYNTVGYVAIVLSGIIYVTWSSILLKRHRRNILNQFSYQDKIDLQWLRILTWGIGGIWLLVFFQNNAVIFAGVVLFVFLIGFFGVRQEKIFTSEKELPGNEEEKEKYSKSGLTEELSEKLYRALLRLMNEEAMYRKNDLSVIDLAAKLNVRPNYLSQIINEKEKKNFYDFVNSYRLEEFKKLLSNPKNQNLTLLSLAFDCGYNSKASFNRHFKKATGQTPSQYFASLVHDTNNKENSHGEQGAG